uniref:STAS domain-containing protein n=1 Tax=Pinguiococcus pyrenoidosus TaxID=172671 RepID=A0A7R9UBE4_9STRA|mmetsp:Transcript_4263/g.16678  ORF Transcript_4263/g.16678 Transcript_4263/m.16678 type:complete len:1130 (+) Transcript_4263:196-3585(+)
METRNSVRENVVKGVVYGVVNGCMVLPVMISFSAIIYRNPAFEPYMPTLVNLTIFSAAVHQLCFTIFSSMPFAVGQVQDAGLIFLAGMASNIVNYARERGHTEEEMLCTTVVLLAGSTLCLGLALLAVGRLNLASYVQYLPMPVVGGYLAFIGLFCGESGMAMMAGVEVAGIEEWYKFADARALMLMAPGVVLGVLIYYAVRNVRSMLTLPACMIVIVSGFYFILYNSGHDLEDARQMGWIARDTGRSDPRNTWDYFKFENVRLEAVPQIIPHWIAMFLVVAFSSSLDVAAIEMELGESLDYNRELMTVGISNFLSGLTGGYTGSYIFSQTIFNLRVGVQSRITGYIITGVELIIFAVPFSAVAYVPKCFFGSLLTMIAVDLCYEWLILARHKMARAEYFVNIATFVAVNACGVELGMVIGIVLAMACFTLAYAQVPGVKSSFRRTSLITRTFQERVILDTAMHDGIMQIFSLQGYIFFGSAVNLLADVKSRIRWPDGGPASLGIERVDSPPTVPKVPSSPSLYTEPTDGKFATAGIAAMPVYNRGGGKGSPSKAGRMHERRMSERDLSEEHGERRRLPRSSSHGSGFWSFMSPSTWDRDGGDQASNDKHHRPESRMDAHIASWGGAAGQAMSERTPLLASRAAQRGSKYGPSGSPASRRRTNGSSQSRVMTNGRVDEESPSFNGARVGLEIESNASSDDVARTVGLGSSTTSVKAWVILDFEKVKGIDATAARACFLILRKLLRTAGVQVVYAAVPDHVKLLLEAHGVINESEDPVFEQVEEALEWCEEKLLTVDGLRYQASSSALALSTSTSAPDLTLFKDKVRNLRLHRLHQRLSEDDPWMSRPGHDPRGSGEAPYAAASVKEDIEEKYGMDRSHPSSDDLFLSGSGRTWEDLRAILFDYIVENVDHELSSVFRGLKYELTEDALTKYFSTEIAPKNKVLFRRGEASDRLYVLRQGEVELLAPMTVEGSTPANGSPNSGRPPDANGTDAMEHRPLKIPISVSKERRIQKITDGGVCGEVGFFLCRPQDFRAVTRTPCQLWNMTRNDFAEMCRNRPTLALMLQVSALHRCLNCARALRQTHRSPPNPSLSRPQYIARHSAVPVAEHIRKYHVAAGSVIDHLPLGAQR